jgi:hypothetical protein
VIFPVFENLAVTALALLGRFFLCLLRGENTFIAHAARAWNASPALRAAATLAEAKRAARLLAEDSDNLAAVAVNMNCDMSVTTGINSLL